MFQTFAAMGETSESPSVTEEGELSNDGDTNDLFVVDSTPRVNENRIEIPVYNKVTYLKSFRADELVLIPHFDN